MKVGYQKFTGTIGGSIGRRVTAALAKVLVKVAYRKFTGTVGGSIGRRVTAALAKVLVKVGLPIFTRSVHIPPNSLMHGSSSEFPMCQIH